jgi:hypothetical protein
MADSMDAAPASTVRARTQCAEGPYRRPSRLLFANESDSH